MKLNQVVELLFLKLQLKKNKDLSTLKIIQVFNPKTGSALVFDHYLYHEGSEVISGVKYAIRSDVFFYIYK